MRAFWAGSRALRAAIPLLFLIEVGILLPLHVHEPANPISGFVLAAGCHAGLPCGDPEHHHPPAPDHHPTGCVACSTAHRPALATNPAEPVASLPDECPLSASRQETARSRAPRSASQRAPPARLPA